MTDRLRNLLREPLLHFLVLGAGLFAVYALVERPVAASPDRVVVTEGDVEVLATTFARTWQRPPTAAELRALVDEHVETEVLGREAIALGLDRGDTVIQRRLRQKMEFVAEDLAATAEPTEDELEGFLRAHPETFREETRTSFRQVYLGEGTEAELRRRSDELLPLLREGADPAELGERLLVPRSFELERRGAVEAQLGRAFAAALDALPVGEWAGPVTSGFGGHLVLVSAREPGRLPELDEIRPVVERELMAERRERVRARMIEGLLERYEVVVEWPAAVREAMGDPAGPEGTAP